MKYYVHKERGVYFVCLKDDGVPIEMSEEEHMEYRKVWNVFERMQVKLERVYDTNKK